MSSRLVMGVFMFTGVIFLNGSHLAKAYDFLEKRECTLHSPKRAIVHTVCVISGGMFNGSIDVAAKTPDGKTYAIFGYLDRRDGWELNKKPAKQTSEKIRANPLCVEATDASLEICIGATVE